MNCRDCRWWRNEEVGLPDRRQCLSPRVLRGYGVRLEDIPTDGALVENDEDWGIFTGPDFGCVAFEASPTHESVGVTDVTGDAK